MSFTDELKALMDKHGVKEDEIKIESKPTEKADKSAHDAEVVAKLSEQIVNKLVDAIEAKEKSTKSVETNKPEAIRAKIFTSWAGIKEVTYPSDLTNLTKDEKIVTFFKALVYEKSDPESARVLRALVEGTDTEGGYLVPEELKAEIFRVLPDFTVMRNIARVIPMSTDTLKLNSLAARPVAYWTSEYSSASTSSAEFGEVTLTPQTLIALLPITEQLLADANVNLVQFINELFAEAIGIAEDRAFFTGSGSGQPRGISQESLSSVDAGRALTFDHMIDVENAVPQRVRRSRGAAYVGHNKVITHLRKLKDTSGNYIWRDATGPGGGQASEGLRPVPMVNGYPFYEQNDLNQRELYFGDWKYYIIGDRQTVSVSTTREGGEAWRRHALEIKAVERVDGKAVITSPFAKITNI